MLIWLVILLRIVSNPFSNVFQKLLTQRRADPIFVIGLTHALMSLVGAPLFFICCRGLGTAFWVDIALVAVLTVVGNVLIVVAVKLSDLSVLGPINAYKSVVSLVLGMVLLQEYPRPQGLCGIALIIAGSYFVVDQKPAAPRRNVFVRFFEDRGVQYRLAALVVSAVEAIFLKKASLESSPLATFAGWAFLGFGASLILLILTADRRGWRAQLSVFKAQRTTYGWLAVTTGVMQFSTIVSFGGLPVGYALALFQISTLLTVFLGWHVFREGKIVERMIGSLVMVAGAVLIVLSR